MQDYEKTTRYHQPPLSQSSGQIVTIFDAGHTPCTISLSNLGKSVITFGRLEENDIVLSSPLVSRHHGRFVLVNGRWRIEDTGSKNGLLFNNVNIRSRDICDGDFIRIDDGVETIAEGVLFVFSSAESENRWYTLPVSGMGSITIGREEGCTITLPHVSVS